jgi:serine/threonine-protein kinase
MDVYALGVVFYELLTGRKPFNATTEASIVQSILFEPPVPAVERRPDLPKTVSKILARALAKDPQQRYPDCLAFHADLEDFILSTGKPVSTHQLAQFISELTGSADSLAPMLQPRSPPAPVPEPKEASGTIYPGTCRLVAPEVPNASPLSPVLQTAELRAPERTDLGMVLSTAPMPSHDMAETLPSEEVFRPPPQQGRLFLAVVGAGLLVAGGGYLFARMETRPAQGAPFITPTADTMPEPKAAPPLDDSPAQSPRDARPPTDALAMTVPEATVLASLTVAIREANTNPDELHTLQAPFSPADDPPGAVRTPQPAPVPKQPASPPPKKSRMGTVEFRIWPYATVHLDGVEIGQTPFEKPRSVPAGKHTVRFVNESLHREVTQSFTVKEGKSTVLKLNLKVE